MTTSPGADDLRAQLRELDEEMDRLRRERDGATGQVGGRDIGAQDNEDRAAALTGIEENEALLAALERRREAVQAKLDPS